MWLPTILSVCLEIGLRISCIENDYLHGIDQLMIDENQEVIYTLATVATHQLMCQSKNKKVIRIRFLLKIEVVNQKCMHFVNEESRRWCLQLWYRYRNDAQGVIQL